MSGFEGADNNNWEAISTFLGRTVCLWKETTEGALKQHKVFKPQGEKLYMMMLLFIFMQLIFTLNIWR